MSKKVLLPLFAASLVAVGGFGAYSYHQTSKNNALVEAELKEKLDSSSVENVMDVSYEKIATSGGVTSAHNIVIDLDGYKVSIPTMEVHDFDTAHPETPYHMTVKVPQFKLPLGEEFESKIGKAKAKNPAIAVLTKNLEAGLNGSYENSYKYDAVSKSIYSGFTLSLNNLGKIKFDANFEGVGEDLFLAQMGGVETLEKYATEKGGMFTILGSLVLRDLSIEYTDNGARDLFLMGAASEQKISIEEVLKVANSKFEMLESQAKTDLEKKVVAEFKKFINGSKTFRVSVKPENGALMGLFMQLQTNPRVAVETLNLEIEAK